MATSARQHLLKQLMDLEKSGTCGFRVEANESNIFEWTVWIAGPPDSPYQKGQYKAQMKFPPDFPFSPPKLRFISKMWHPNVYSGGERDGELCLSILHPPGDDEWGYESAAERWNVVRSIESVIISVIATLSEPNCESPANVDAAKDLAKDREAFNKKVRALAEQSLKELPPDYVYPPMEVKYKPAAPLTGLSPSYGGDEVEEEEDEDEEPEAPSTSAAPSSEDASLEEKINTLIDLGVDAPREELRQKLLQKKGDVERVAEMYF